MGRVMRRVLVVEDSSAMRGLITSIVEEVADCEVVEVEGGFDALRALPGHRFALIITDINMPDINGFELLGFVRKSPDHADTPVLIVTSDESDRQRQRALELGANQYLHKPFATEDLRAAVHGLLREASTTP